MDYLFYKKNYKRSETALEGQFLVNKQLLG